MNFFLSIILIFLSFKLFAQVGINTNTPNATLDVNSANTASAKDGLIPPKLTRQELANKLIGTYTNAQAGAIVYITDITVPTGTPPSLTQTTNITTLGYYYFDGSLWQKIGADTTNDAWINGTGRVELSTKANGSTRDAKTDVSVYDNGRIGVGIGSESPDGGIHIRGDGDGWKDDIRLDSYDNSTTGPAANFRFHSSKGLTGNLENLTLDNSLGQINFHGRVNNAFPSLGRIWSTYKGDGTTSFSNFNISISGSTNYNFHISETGYVGINTGNPQGALHVRSFGNTSSTKALNVINSESNSLIVALDNGYTGINTGSPRVTLDVNGFIATSEQIIEVPTTGVLSSFKISKGQLSFTGNRTLSLEIKLGAGSPGMRLVIVNNITCTGFGCTPATLTIVNDATPALTILNNGISSNTVKEFIYSNNSWKAL